jgi:dihydrofolate synthase/folylpolyglutamate synthase
LENGAVAVAVLTAVSPHFPQLTVEAIRAGLANVTWHGRLQTLHTAPTLLVDCAHNADAAIRLRHALTHDYEYDKLWLIIAASAGKDISGILSQLLPLATGAVATISSHPRAAQPEEIVKQAAQAGFSMTAESDLATAVAQTWQKAGPHDLICVTGSIFVVGDLLNQWENLKIKLLSKEHTVEETAVSHKKLAL